MTTKGAAARRKGREAERDVATIYQARGLTVRGLESAGDHLTITAAGRVIHSEVKRQERLRVPEWLAQLERDCPAGAIPVLSFRQNRGRWYACLPLEELVGLIA